MQERPIYFYMANLWSEVEKIFIYKEKGENEAMQSALKRAQLIFDKVRSFENKSANFEVDVLESVLVDLFSTKRKYFADRTQLSSYLNSFALRVMAR